MALLKKFFQIWKKDKTQLISETASNTEDERETRFCRQDIVEAAQRIRQSENISDIIEHKGYYVSDGLIKESADKTETVIIDDGEVLNYECLACGNTFERELAYGCCCPNKWMRKKILEEHPIVCPACGSTDVKRVRKGFWLGGEPEEWE